jgi:hypothetical protein
MSEAENLPAMSYLPTVCDAVQALLDALAEAHAGLVHHHIELNGNGSAAFIWRSLAWFRW